MVPHDSHFTHRPSVRTLRSSGGVACSIDFFSRLNQAIVRSGQYRHDAGSTTRDLRHFKKKAALVRKAAVSSD